MSPRNNTLMQDPSTEIMPKLLERLEQRCFQLPAATYRMQFHSAFPFRDACKVVPYLCELGITHCYASPFLKARPGSTHGYDIADHRLINPEIGSEEDFAAWADCLHAHGMGQILDMVPNHMGVIGNENPWWQDVLENGPASQYANYFDIAWQSSLRPELQNRVLIPILGDPYGKVLESGQLQLAYHDGAIFVHYFDHRFPLDPSSYDAVLNEALPTLEQDLPADDLALMEYRSILTAISHLPPQTASDAEQIAERLREKEVIKRRIATLVQDHAMIRQHVDAALHRMNGDAGDRESFNQLHDLLDRQAFRLSFWRVASDEINYRRFFDVNELAALNMELEEVFVATHDFVLRLLATEKLDGLRIDHPDGLYDPKQYLQWTQEHYLLALARDIYEAETGNENWSEIEPTVRSQIQRLWHDRGPQFRPLYVVVEKILGGNEHLSTDWMTHGTSGYDFLNVVNGIFVDSTHAEAFTRFYAELIEDAARFPEVAYRKKALILEAVLSSELHMLASQLDRLAQKDRWSRDFTFNGLRQALAETIACFPVYRSYISDEGVSETDKLYVQNAIHRAIGRNPAISRWIFYFIRDMVLLKYRDHFGAEDQLEQRRFAGKFQQVTSPVAAKGIEDTAFYVYTRLISLNEVGGEPERFGITIDKFHRYCEDRQKHWPYSLSPLSTHDTKRSEDVRARINVLSEIPNQWQAAVTRWCEMNRVHRRCVDDAAVPDRNEEYFLYQTLIGAWPLGDDHSHVSSEFVKRIQSYMAKALHEAKIHSSWINPNSEYDAAISDFVERLLNPELNSKFLEDFCAFQQRISRWGMLNSLAQTVLRITLPGVPDTYQGTELWDFSLVDPDNRRPVDYELRHNLLRGLKDRIAKARGDRRDLVRELLEQPDDGRIKLYVTWQALRSRREQPELFTSGDYVPLDVDGPKKDHAIAFARRDSDQTAVVVVPRKVAVLSPDAVIAPDPSVWETTTVRLDPSFRPLRLRNAFTGELIEPASSEGELSYPISHLLGQFPVALLMSESP